MADTALRPLSTSQLLDRTFHLYRNNFWLFAGIAILPPALELMLELTLVPAAAFAPGAAPDPTVLLRLFLYLGAQFIVVYLIGSSIAEGATIHAVSRVHLGAPTGIAEAYRAIMPLMPRIIGIVTLVGLMLLLVYIATYIVVLIPTILLVVGAAAAGGRSPAAGIVLGVVVGLLVLAGIVGAIFVGVWIYCRYSLAVPTCVLEKLPATQCLRRSSYLSKKSILRIALVFLLMWIIKFAAAAVLSIPTFIGMGMNHGVQTLPFRIWGYTAGFVAGTVAGPIASIAVALLYYDQRVRKEAFDLQLMMEAIGVTGPRQPVAAPAPPTIG
ncbi:MAG TPA: hypothetical protein VEW69_05235 [Alphaproteobacteria bacterium]|nr:hypothetical protein [Alphaproteobacteria bacterium]